MHKQIKPIFSIVALALLVLFFACGGNKPAIREVRKEHRLMDSADVLTIQQEDSLFTIIQDLEKNVGSQIGVLTILSLKGEKIEERSLRTANRLGLGRADYDDGILILIAVMDRQIRIEVGYGLEKIIKDEIAARIIRENMAPRFHDGDMFGGIKAGVERVKKLIEENRQRVGEHN